MTEQSEEKQKQKQRLEKLIGRIKHGSDDEVYIKMMGILKDKAKGLFNSLEHISDLQALQILPPYLTAIDIEKQGLILELQTEILELQTEIFELQTEIFSEQHAANERQEQILIEQSTVLTRMDKQSATMTRHSWIMIVLTIAIFAAIGLQIYIACKQLEWI